MYKTKIVLVDDHVFLLDLMANLLKPEFALVGTFSDGHAFLKAVAELAPDVVVLDIGMPGLSGIGAATRVRKLLPRVKIVFLTMNFDRNTLVEAFRSGADGYVLKTSAAVELVQAIRTVSIGRSFVSQDLTEGVGARPFIDGLRKVKSPHGLTRRQLEILRLVVEGLRVKEIAEVLDITPRTVAFHKNSILQKLRLKTTAEMIAYGVEHSLALGPRT